MNKEQLLEEVKGWIAEGISQTECIDRFMREKWYCDTDDMPEKDYEILAEVADRITGWCHVDLWLFPNPRREGI